MSFMLPIHLIRLRAFPWDEWILKKIDQFEKVEMKQARGPFFNLYNSSAFWQKHFYLNFCLAYF